MMKKLSPVQFSESISSVLPVPDRSYIIAVAVTGYVGLSLAILLVQHNEVTAIDILPEKVEKLNHYISPIQDEYIEKYLEEAKTGKRRLKLTATLDGTSAYEEADFIIIAVPTSYDGGRTGVEHLVYGSSSSVYGGNKKVPFSTEDKTDTPVSLYAATKKAMSC